jgi:signal transduction histidine kinase
MVDRWRAWTTTLRRATSSPPRLSRWAWAADAILAAAVAVGTLNGARSRDYDSYGIFIPRPDAHQVIGPDGILPPLIPDPPPPPFVPGPSFVPDPALTHSYGPVSPWQPFLALLAALALVARRRYPLTVFWVVIFASQLYHVDPGYDPTFTFAACLIAAYSAIMYSPYRIPAIVSTLLGAGLIVGRHVSDVPAIKPGLSILLIMVPIGLTANAINVWRQRVRAMEEQREAATQLAVDQERSRIARELHDVVTHNVSVMVVQAGAARKIMDTAPEQAREAMLAVESGGRAAMAELRHVMGLLTMDSDGPDPAMTSDLAPQPGLDQVAALAARIRDTGVPIELIVTGPPVALPTGAGLAAYRVVQEALTNTMKHAAGAGVRIAIDYTPDAVRVEVTDTGGTSTAPVGAGNGRGLIGLRERLAVYGGTLSAGRRPTGGYRVLAAIPIGDS